MPPTNDEMESMVASELSIGVFGGPTPSGRVKVISDLASNLVRRLLTNPSEIYQLTPDQFEELLRDRLRAMRYDVTRVGSINQPDGGVDLIFYPKVGCGIPFLGAIQIKHHASPLLKTGLDVVQRMACVLERHRSTFNLGMVVTNTSFTTEAQWFVQPMQLFLRLRNGQDVQRWIEGRFDSAEEWRDFAMNVKLGRHVSVGLGNKGRL
jgi:hypothetical protein